jgi:hypothetical protein
LKIGETAGRTIVRLLGIGGMAPSVRRDKNWKWSSR